jgi:hypothetical protein
LRHGGSHHICCAPGSQKCVCHEDNTCDEGLACYEQTLEGYPEGRFCGLDNLGIIPGLDPV